MKEPKQTIRTTLPTSVVQWLNSMGGAKLYLQLDSLHWYGGATKMFMMINDRLYPIVDSEDRSFEDGTPYLVLKSRRR